MSNIELAINDYRRKKMQYAMRRGILGMLHKQAA